MSITKSQKDNLMIVSCIISAIGIIGYVIILSIGLIDDNTSINNQLDNDNISCSHLKDVRNILSHNPLDFDLVSKIDDKLARGECK